MGQAQAFTLETEYQSGPHEIRVVTPDRPSSSPRRVLYVLPVEPEFQSRFGQPLPILAEMDAANRYNLILVQMGFEKEPWYGDHATDPRTRQASYLRHAVVPLIERRFDTLGKSVGRLLFGFSKSGWGALSLILHDPDFYGYAATWDAPLLLQTFFLRMEAVYGTPGQLAKFRPDLLIPKQAEFFRDRPRIVLTGEQGWGRSVPAPGGGSHTVEAHEMLQKYGIPHVYDPTLAVPHRWDRAWMEPTLYELMKLTEI